MFVTITKGYSHKHKEGELQMGVKDITRSKKGKVLGPISLTKEAQGWDTGGIIKVTGYTGTMDFWTSPTHLRAIADAMEKASDEDDDNIIGFAFNSDNDPLSVRILWKVRDDDLDMTAK